MEKTKKRNELSIFEELRLKPPTNARTKEHFPRWDCVKVKYIFKSNKILSLPELKILFNEDELLVVKKGNRLSILPVQNQVAKILLEKI